MIGKRKLRAGALLLLTAVAAAAAMGPARAAASWDATLIRIIALEDARDAHDLTPLARAPEARVRARAVRALGCLQNRATIPLLATLARDSDARVRAEAVFALGQMWSAAAEKPLVQLLKAPPDHQDAVLAVEGLGKCAAFAGVGFHALAGALASTDAIVRRFAGTALGVYFYRFHQAKRKWRPLPTVAKALADHLADSSGSARFGAAYGLYRMAWAGGTGEVAAWGGVLVKVAQRDPLARVRIPAAQALGECLAAGRQVPGVPALAQDRDWRLRVVAWQAMGRAAGRSAGYRLDEAALRTAVFSDSNALVRVAALRALEEASRHGAPPQILTRARIDGMAPEQVQAEAIQAYAAQSGEATEPELADAARASRPALRIAAAAAWAELLQEKPSEAFGARGRAAMAVLARDSDVRVRSAALEAYGDVPAEPTSTAVLLAALSDPDVVVRATAADVLGKRRVRAAVAAMIGALRAMRPADEVEEMMTVIEALGAIGDRAAIPGLMPYLASRDANVARDAAAALTRITKRKVKPPPPRPRTDRLDPEAARFIVRAIESAREGSVPEAVVHTSRGDLVLRLLPEAAPLTVYNFVKLARARFYNGVSFHRVVPNFVVQGGDPRGDGWGGPGYTIRCEYNPLRYGRGAVGMALAGKDTGGSQWFITHSAQPHLDGRYTIFAQLVVGGDVLDALTAGDTIRSVDVTPSDR